MPQPGIAVDVCQPLNMAHPLNRGIVAKWLILPNGQWSRGTKLYDLVSRGHSNIGTLTNGPTWAGSRGRPGGWGSLGFDGTDDRADLPNCSTFLRATAAASSATLTAWIRSTAASASDNRILSFTRDGGNTECAILAFRSTTKISAFARDAATGLIQVDSSGSGYNDGAWHHIAWSIGPPNATLYVDGVPAGTSSSVGAAATFNWGAFPARIGANAVGTAVFFGGNLDDVSIYSRALSATEILALCRESSAGYPECLRWLGRRSYFVPGAATGNRRRRILMLAG